MLNRLLAGIVAIALSISCHATDQGKKEYFDRVLKESKGDSSKALSTVFFDEFYSCKNSTFNSIYKQKKLFEDLFGVRTDIAGDKFGYWFVSDRDDLYSEFKKKPSTNYGFSMLGAMFMENRSKNKRSVYWGVLTSYTVEEILKSMGQADQYKNIHGALTRTIYFSADMKQKVLMYVSPEKTLGAKSVLVCLYEENLNQRGQQGAGHGFCLWGDEGSAK